MECKSFEIWDCYLKPFLDNNPSLGWYLFLVFVFVQVIQFLISVIPQLEVLKSKIYLPLAKTINTNWLAKKAIDANIRGNVNTFVQKLDKELPDGWLKSINIRWVSTEDKNKFFEDEKTVIVMRPVKDQNHNFVLAVHEYFKKNLFPKTVHVIPEIVLESVTIRLSQRLIEQEKKELIETFENEVLEPAIKRKKSILKNLGRYKNIDQRGFFTGTFLREIHRIAKIVRFEERREELPQEANDIVKHIEKFITYYNSKEEKIPESEWARIGRVLTYKFLLVASPLKESKDIINGYVNRAREASAEKVQNFYVYGTKSQERFFKKVITAICRQVPNFKLIEQFEPYYDYRGDKGGLCALFEYKNY